MTVPPGLTHVGRLELTYDEALLYETHAGARGFSQAISGSLTGPRVTGKLADDGGDWLTFRSDGVIDTDSRVMIETGDGALLYMRSRGCIRATPEALAKFRAGDDTELSGFAYRCAPWFDAPPGDYEWLSQTLLVGIGTLSRRGSTLDLYEVR